jgi:hypothetical protein
MIRISAIIGVSGTLAVLPFSANVAHAGSVTVHTTVPAVTVHPTVTPKFQSLATGTHFRATTITPSNPTVHFHYGQVKWRYMKQNR